EINSGESKQVSVTLTKTITANDTGTYTNNAAIKQISNQKGTEDSNSQNNSSQAQVIISISTGLIIYISITVVIIGLITLAIFLVLKFKVKLIKIGKFGLFSLIFVGIMIFQSTSSLAIDMNYYYTNFKWIYTHTFSGGPLGQGGK